MKKSIAFLLALSLLLAFALSASALLLTDSTVSLRSIPDDNVDSPDPLPYSSFIHIRNSTKTRAISVPSDGTVTGTLSNACMSFGGGGQCKVNISAAYWNGSTWIPANVSPNYIMVTKNPSTYTFTVSGLHQRAFYVLFSKVGSGYDSYYFDSNIYIAN